MSDQKKLNRRDFLKGAAISGAGLAAVGALGASSTTPVAAQAATPAPTPTSAVQYGRPGIDDVPVAATPVATPVASNLPAKWDYEADVVVAGGGLGGLTAALAAQKGGAKVIVVEAYQNPGGTAPDSGGGVSCSILSQPDPVAAIPQVWPYGDPDLLKVFIENYPKAKALLIGTGAPVVDASPSAWTIGKEKTFASRYAFIEAVVEVFQAAGGTLLTSIKAIKLVVNDSNAVLGLTARGKDGKLVNLKGKAVILGTGGFQNNPEMKVKYLGRWGDMALNRSVPTNDGTGIQMALAIGAKMSKGLGSYYGHTLPAPPAKLVFGELADWGSQYYDIYSIIVNLDGERFFDEAAGIAGDPLNQQMVQQRYGRAVIILDQKIYSKYSNYSPVEPNGPTNRPQAVKDHGGHITSAPTIEELAKNLAAWGYNSTRLVQTFNEFNAAVDAGKAGQLMPPKTDTGLLSKGAIIKLDTPPFWAVEIAGGISCCYGGLAINTSSQVLNTEDAPIEGLFAIPGTAGGITTVDYYNSSLGALTAFGFLAGTNAAKLKAAT